MKFMKTKKKPVCLYFCKILSLLIVNPMEKSGRSLYIYSLVLHDFDILRNHRLTHLLSEPELYAYDNKALDLAESW